MPKVRVYVPKGIEPLKYDVDKVTQEGGALILWRRDKPDPDLDELIVACMMMAGSDMNMVAIFAEGRWERVEILDDDGNKQEGGN